MSLINEALKKAQRQRSEDQASLAPMPGGGGTIAKRGQPRSANSILLLGGAALALVIVSVGITIYFFSRSKSSSPPVIASTPTTAETPKPVATRAPPAPATKAPATNLPSPSTTAAVNVTADSSTKSKAAP